MNMPLLMWCITTCPRSPWPTRSPEAGSTTQNTTYGERGSKTAVSQSMRVAACDRIMVLPKAMEMVAAGKIVRNRSMVSASTCAPLSRMKRMRRRTRSISSSSVAMASSSGGVACRFVTRCERRM